MIELLKKHKYTRLIIIEILIIIVLLAYVKYKNNSSAINNAIPIRVVKAIAQDVPIYLTSLGNVTPELSVNLQPQISGKIIKSFYINGALVNKGDILVELDPSVYQAQITQYQGQVTSNQALLDNALVDLKRYQALWKENAISNQILATQVASVEQYKGAVASAQGLLDNAKVNLGYCTIKAPFSGMLGIHLITAGNVVDPSSVIAVLNSVEPIAVLFNLPQAELADLKKANTAKMQVESYNTEGVMSKGFLVGIDSQINAATGTIQLKALYENKDHKLFPNQFVNVKLLLKTLENSLVVPSSAVQYGPDGPFVYLIRNNIAKTKAVKIYSTIEGNAIITSGIKAGDKIAIEGVDKLSDNIPVIISAKG